MKSKKFVSLVMLSAVCMFLTAAAANADTMSAFDWGYHDAAPGTAEAYYSSWDGQLFFNVGEGVGVIGISAPEIYRENVDRDAIFGYPAQNDGTILAYFSASGLPVGEDSVGLVLPPGLFTCSGVEGVTFAYTPLGGETQFRPVNEGWCPEPSTTVMALFGLGILGVYWRRRGT